MDAVFIVVIALLYASTHWLICGVAKLGDKE